MCFIGGGGHVCHAMWIWLEDSLGNSVISSHHVGSCNRTQVPVLRSSTFACRIMTASENLIKKKNRYVFKHNTHAVELTRKKKQTLQVEKEQLAWRSWPRTQLPQKPFAQSDGSPFSTRCASISGRWLPLLSHTAGSLSAHHLLWWWTTSLTRMLRSPSHMIVWGEAAAPDMGQCSKHREKNFPCLFRGREQ